LTSRDVGHTVRVAEAAVNAGGSGTAASSLATQVVLPLPPASIGGPQISGSPVEGHTLTETHGAWSNGVTSLADQWTRCDATGASCTAIAGATGQSYTPTHADVDHAIRVLEIAGNAGGQAGPADSSLTAIVAPSPARVK